MWYDARLIGSVLVQNTFDIHTQTHYHIQTITHTPKHILFSIIFSDTQPPAIGGIHDEFIFAPRLDNLFNTYCALQGLLEATEEGLSDEKNVRMICLYDNEEVGSASAQGAGSKLTELIMKRVCEGKCSSVVLPLRRCICSSILDHSAFFWLSIEPFSRWWPRSHR